MRISGNLHRVVRRERETHYFRSETEKDALCLINVFSNHKTNRTRSPKTTILYCIVLFFKKCMNKRREREDEEEEEDEGLLKITGTNDEGTKGSKGL